MPDRFAKLRGDDIARILLTENAGAVRYLVVPAAHHSCCYDQSVVDSHALDDDGAPRLLCECTDEAAANRIAAALNAREGGASNA